MRLVWSARSLEDRRAIYAFNEVDSPRAAMAVDERIGEAARRLLDFPESGRLGRVEGTRKLVVARTPFVTPYAVAEGAVRILRVLHGARKWPHSCPLDDI